MFLVSPFQVVVYELWDAGVHVTETAEHTHKRSRTYWWYEIISGMVK